MAELNGDNEVVAAPTSLTNFISDTFNSEVQKYKDENTMTKQMENQLKTIDVIGPLLIKTMALAIEKLLDDKNKVAECEKEIESVKVKMQKVSLAQRYAFDKLEAHDRDDN